MSARTGRLLAAAVRLLLLLLAVLTLLPASSAGAQAADQPPAADGAPGEAAAQLAERHRPVLQLKAQDGTCDPDGEPYAPIPVDAVLGNPRCCCARWATPTRS